MRKFFGILFGLLVLVVAAVLIGPSFVNWNDYKGELARRIQEMTGRELTINGDIRIAILPAPALVARDISFANLDGARSRQMVTLKSAEVRIALGPLLGGRVKVETVNLIEPVIHLERLSDGTANWEFQAPLGTSGSAPASSGTSSGGGGDTLPAVALDNLTVENATLIYRDAVSGVSERIEKLNAQIAAASLKGPLETSGAAIFKGLPVSFHVNVGEIIHDRTVPFTARMAMSGEQLKAQITGTLVNLTEIPKFKGSVKLESADFGSAIAAISPGDLPALLAQPFRASGEVTATAADIHVQKIMTTLGAVRANGDLQIDLGDKPSINSSIGIKKIDLDALLATPRAALKKSTKRLPTSAAVSAAPVAAVNKSASPLRFELPKALEASVLLSVDAIVFRDGIIRDALVNATLADGLLTVSQASAQFPGGSDLSAALKLHTPGGIPAFSAQLDSTVNDLRGVIRWLKVDLPSVPADRLRKLSFQTALSGTQDQVQVSGLDLRFDSSRLTGGVTVAIRDRLGIGANLTLDRFNLDAYLPTRGKATKATGKKPAAGKAAAGEGANKIASSPANPFAILGAVTGIDANIKAHVKTLVYNANPIKDLVADATLYNGDLDIRRLSAGKLAGASASLRGKLLGLGGVPQAKALMFETQIADLARLARLAGTKLPPPAKKLGAIRAKGRIDGALLRPRIEASAALAGAVVGIKGRVSLLPGSDQVDAHLSLQHKDVTGLARRFGIKYRPSGKLGGIDVSGDIKASADRIDVANLRASIGKLTLRGNTRLTLSGPKPVIQANLTTGPLVVDPFLPPAPKASRQRPRTTRRAGTARPAKSTPVRPADRFSTDPIDLSFLHEVDGEFSFKAPMVAYQRLLIENPDIAVTVRNGVLETQRLTGHLFEGKLSAAIGAAAGPRNRFGIKAKIDGVNMAKSLTAVTGEALANGRMALDLDLATEGLSPRDLVSALAGTTAVALTDVDVEKAGKGSMMSGLLGLLTSLNKLGGSNKNDRAQMTGNFKIVRGVARTNDIKLASAYGNGVAVGDINLPAWTINVEGQMTLAQNFVTQLLRAKIRESRSAVPFAITGALDAPNVKVDTGALLGAGVPIPGADALLNKAPKGVGKILRSILGGGAQPQQPTTAPLPTPPPVTSGGQPAPAEAPPPPTQQNTQPIKPGDLLKKLFKL